MKTKLIVGMMALFAVPAFASDVTCEKGAQAFGSPGRGEVACVTVGADGSRVFQGQFVAYWPNGAKQSVGQMEAGARIGKWTFFDQSGIKTGETTFKADRWHGERVKFHSNGMRKSVDVWANGERTLATVYFDQAGSTVLVDGSPLVTK